MLRESKKTSKFTILLKANFAFAEGFRSREMSTELTISEKSIFALANHFRSHETETESTTSDTFSGKAILLSRPGFALAKLDLTRKLHFWSLSPI